MGVAHRERWTHADELLALVLEKLDELLILTGAGWTAFLDPKKRSTHRTKPFRYPRPVKPPPPRPATVGEIARFFAR